MPDATHEAQRETPGYAASSTKLDRVAGTIQRIAGVLRWLIRRMTALAIASIVAAVSISAIVWDRTSPLDQVDTLALILLSALLLAPAAILLFYAVALRGILQLPGHMREVAERTARHGSDMGQAARDLHSQPGVRSIWSTMRTVTRIRGDLIAYIPTVKILNPAFTLLAILSIPAGIAVTVIGVLSVLVWLVRM